MGSSGRLSVIERAKALLAPYSSSEPLSEGRSPDGKSLVNKSSQQLSSTYATFPDPITRENNGFDIHGKLV